jgi:P27 family predicted phage terminase small subunit
MPTKTISANNMTPGGKAGGKHWTKTEVEERQAAAESLRRKNKTTLVVPKWLNTEARIVWRQVRYRLKGIELLDNLDTEMLAVYCDAYVQYRRASKVLAKLTEPDPDKVKELQAWARIMAMYADKLGLTPGGRARLAKRKAEKRVDKFNDTFDS